MNRLLAVTPVDWPATGPLRSLTDDERAAFERDGHYLKGSHRWGVTYHPLGFKNIPEQHIPRFRFGDEEAVSPPALSAPAQTASPGMGGEPARQIPPPAPSPADHPYGGFLTYSGHPY